MRENNFPEPRFETDADRIYFLVVLPVHLAWLPTSNQVGNQVGDQAEDELPVVVGEAYWQYLARLVREIAEQGRSLDDGPTDRYRPVVQFLKPDYAAVLRACQTPKSRKEVLEETLRRTNQLKNAKRFLDPLLVHGFLARTIPESPNSPTQKYVTTERGRLALQLLERTKNP